LFIISELNQYLEILNYVFWNNGMMEQWVLIGKGLNFINQKTDSEPFPNIPAFHFSNIPKHNL